MAGVLADFCRDLAGTFRTCEGLSRVFAGVFRVVREFSQGTFEVVLRFLRPEWRREPCRSFAGGCRTFTTCEEFGRSLAGVCRNTAGNFEGVLEELCGSLAESLAGPLKDFDDL